MRPQDTVILLKIVVKGDESWYMKDLSQELGISASEISESLNRSTLAELVTPKKKGIRKRDLLEFLLHGLKYVYPQRPVDGSRHAHGTQRATVVRSNQEHRAICVAVGKRGSAGTRN